MRRLAFDGVGAKTFGRSIAWLCGVATVIGAVLSLSSPLAAQDRVSRLITRADTLRERGRSDAAWAVNRRAVSRAPGDERAVMALAAALPTDVHWPIEDVTQERANQVRDALLGLGTAPPSAESRHALAWAHALGGELPRAVDVAASAVRLQDHAASTWLQRIALLAVRAGAYDTARNALLAAHRAVPQDSAVLSDLGAVELALGLPDAAIPRFERVLGRSPDDLRARRDLAGALVAAGRASEAVSQLQRCLEAHPEASEVRLELSRAALDASLASVAESAARGAIRRLADDDPRGWAALGDALVARGRAEPAGDAYREALSRDADDVRARRGLRALTESAGENRADSRDNR